MTQTTLPIDAIRIPPDYIRKDLGDLRELAQSFGELSMHTPILVTENNALCDGLRRLEGAKLAGWSDVPVRVLPINTETGRRAVEVSAALQRKEFSPTEKLAAGRYLEAIEKQAARERQSVGRPTKEEQKATPKAKTGEKKRPAPTAAEKVAATLGWSRGTHEKAVELERRAPDLWAKVQGEYDRNGKCSISGFYKALQERDRHEAVKNSVPPPATTRWRVDCCDALALLDDCKDGSVDLLLTDPPYNIGGKGAAKVGDAYQSFDPEYGDSMPDDQHWDKVEGWVKAMAPKIHPQGAIVMMCDRVMVTVLWDILRDAGLHPKNVLVWTKANPNPNPRRNFDSAYETAVWAVKSSGRDGYTFNRPPTGLCTNTFSAPLVSGSVREKFPHPDVKPVSLASYWIEVLSHPGQTVLDPFCGTGAFLDAALSLDRVAIGCDNVEKYVGLARLRLHEREQEMARAGALGVFQGATP